MATAAVSQDIRTGADDGFTLIEILVTVMLSVLVLSVAGGLLISTSRAERQVSSLDTAASASQLASNSITRGIRNASELRVTAGGGNDRLLVARTATAGNTLSWVCSAWFYQSATKTLRYKTSPTAIPMPAPADLASWTQLAENVTPIGATAVFIQDSPTKARFAWTVASSASGAGAAATAQATLSTRSGVTGGAPCF